MALISYAIFGILFAVSIVHIGWAFGMVWPAKTRADLVATVVGAPNGSPMPPTWLTLLVAVAIFGLGVLALWGAGVVLFAALEAYKGWVLLSIVVVFALRGALTYMPFGPLQASVEPFRTLDLRYFAPLCLLLAAGYLAIYLSL